MKAFTLIELLIVIGLILILAAASAPIYNSLQVQAQLDETSAQIVQTLRTAKERANARYNNASHGVFFDINLGGDDFYILYQGDSYDTRDTSYDREIKLASPLSFINSNFTLTGANIDVNFQKGSGRPDNVGSVILRHDVQGNRVISVNEKGTTQD